MLSFQTIKLLKGRVYDYLANFILLATVDAYFKYYFTVNDDDDKLMLLKVSTN